MAGHPWDSRFTLQPMAGALGARIEGVDLAQPLAEDVLEALREAFRTYLVLAFPDQGHLTPAQQARFASNWGQLQKLPAGTIDDDGVILDLTTGGDRDRRSERSDAPEAQKLARPDIWHADQIFRALPSVGFVSARPETASGGRRYDVCKPVSRL